MRNPPTPTHEYFDHDAGAWRPIAAPVREIAPKPQTPSPGAVAGALRYALAQSPGAHGRWYPASDLAGIVATLCTAQGAAQPDARGLARILRAAGFERRRTAAGVRYRWDGSGPYPDRSKTVQLA